MKCRYCHQDNTSSHYCTTAHRWVEANEPSLLATVVATEAVTSLFDSCSTTTSIPDPSPDFNGGGGSSGDF